MTVRNEASGPESAGPLDEAIVDYYDQTWVDYRLLWLNPDNLAVHHGYTDESTRGHTDALKNMNHVLAQRAAIEPGERVLDAGCGVGGSSLWLAQERDVDVVGITLSAGQLAMARRYADQRGLADRVQFEQADFTATPSRTPVSTSSGPSRACAMRPTRRLSTGKPLDCCAPADG